MAYIETRKSKLTGKTVFRVQLQASKKKFTATFDRKTDARNWAEDIKVKARLNQNFAEQHSSKRTVADVIDRYQRTVLQQPGKEKTKRDRGHQLQWWQDRLGELPINNLSTSVLSECKEELQSTTTHQGPTRSSATVNRYLAAFSHVLTTAKKEWQWIDVNPMEGISKLREARPRQRYLQKEEIRQIRSECLKSRNTQLEVVFLIAIFTGMRRGEILALNYGAINIPNRTISILESKNGKSRGVPISDAL